MRVNRQLEEILSWRFVTEILRRFPSKFSIIEAHPCSGQYDCLVLSPKDRVEFAIDVNRGGGSVHVHQSALGIGDDTLLYSDWLENMLGDNPVSFLDKISRDARLEIPHKLPLSTPEVITYRFISEFLTHSIGRLEKWECRNGYFDSSMYSAVNQGWFSSFPKLRDYTEVRDLEWSSDESYAYNFWFLLKNGTPMLCLDTKGKAYDLDNNTFDLAAIYKESRRIWDVIFKVSGGLLP